MIEIYRYDVRTLMTEGAQLVEVLPAKEFHAEHLPGAINIPLKKLDRRAVAQQLREDQPVIVYCYDFQ